MSKINEKLQSYIDRIERLEENKQDINEDIKQVLAEATNNGFDTKAIRKIVSIRKKDPSDVAEEDAILETYKASLGML